MYIGGSAGCIVAARLASADPNLSVLVVEGGHDNYQDPAIIHTGLFFGHIMPGNKSTIFYQSKPSPHLNGRAPAPSAGSVLGGSSSINMGAYNRPAASDYGAWKVPGWTYKELLPFIKKVSLVDLLVNPAASPLPSVLSNCVLRHAFALLALVRDISRKR